MADKHATRDTRTRAAKIYEKFLKWDARVNRAVMPWISYGCIVIGFLGLFGSLLSFNLFGGVASLAMIGMGWYVVRQ